MGEQVDGSEAQAMKEARHRAVELLKEIVQHEAGCAYGVDGVTNCFCNAETNLFVVLDAIRDSPDDDLVSEALSRYWELAIIERNS